MALNDLQKAWVKEQWIAGGSASEIARKLASPGAPVSRNVVIGVISRAGLQRGPGNPVIRLPRPQLARSPRPPARAPEAVAADIAPDPTMVVGLMEVEKAHCRFPVELPGDPRFLYCGRARQAGSPFCPGHFVIATQPKKDRRK